MELIHNMSFTAIAVFLVTLVVLANLWTCLMVFTCVAFTIVSSSHALPEIILSLVSCVS